MRSSVSLVSILSSYIHHVLNRVQLWDLPRLKGIVVSLASDFSNFFDILSSQKPILIPMYITRTISDIVTAVVLCTSLYQSRMDMNIGNRRLKLLRVPIVYGINGFIITT
jgi:hypothetical protein